MFVVRACSRRLACLLASSVARSAPWNRGRWVEVDIRDPNAHLLCGFGCAFAELFYALLLPCVERNKALAI